MYSIEQLESAQQRIKSGADFPKYIKEIKLLGVKRFETWVKNSQTEYFGSNNFGIKSKPKYDSMTINNFSNKELFLTQLKKHQKGETEYYTFCKDCAASGVEKWVMDLEKMTCTYFDKSGTELLGEAIPEI